MIPVKEPHRITSAFGIKRVLPDKKTDIHNGIDLVSDSGDRSLFAVCDGLIIDDRDDYNDALRWKSKHDSVGNRVVQKSEINGNTYFISYYHMDKNLVEVGDKITKGQLIGSYADVGYSFGAHVHFIAWDKNWKVVDPAFLFKI